MFILNCRIKNETIKKREYLLFDVSEELMNFRASLNQLSEENISAIILSDRMSKQTTILKKGIKDTFSDGKLVCSVDTMRVIINMIDDCLADKAFPGYHFDYETNNKVDVTFLLRGE